MILLIDNYDSFSYNLYQLIGAVEPDIKVVRNDECTLEEIAKMAILTLTVDPGALPAPQHVLDKHFMRKHGPNAYYGQK